MAEFGHTSVERDIERHRTNSVDWLAFEQGCEEGSPDLGNWDWRKSTSETTNYPTITSVLLNNSPLWTRLTLSGALAGTVTKTSTAPLDRIKVLLQVQSMNTTTNDKYRGLLGTTRTILTEEGFFTLWKGNGANCARVVPVYACRFAFNDLIKQAVREPGQSTKELRVSQLALSGTCAGLMQQLICYPFETVRTRLSLGRAFGTQYTGITDCFVQMVRTEGPGSLYRGLIASCLYGAPYVGLNMTLNTEAQRLMVSDLSELSLVHRLCAGSFAATMAQCIVFPFDTLRRRMQADGQGGKPRLFSGLVDCGKQLWKGAGVRGFYTGLVANCVRMVPTGAIQHGAYAFFKSLLHCD